MPLDRRAALVPQLDSGKVCETADHIAFGHLMSCIQSAAGLCKEFGRKNAFARLASHKGDQARFAEVRQQLNEAEGGLHLSLAIDQAGWRDAQEQDQRDAMLAIEEIIRTQGKAQGTLEEMKAQMELLTILVQRDRAKADYVDKSGGDEMQLNETYVIHFLASRVNLIVID